MNHLDLIEDYISSEKQHITDYLLSQRAAYFPPPIAANISLDKIGYTSDLISQIASEQKAATLMNDFLEKQRQELCKLANPRLDLKSILEHDRTAIIEAANPRSEIISKIREELALDLISTTAHHYRPNSRRISTQQPAKRPKYYENPNSYAPPSNTVEAKSKPEKSLSVDHSRLKRIAEHEKRLAELKENTCPNMEIRQIVLMLMPDIDANQEREALAKAIIKSIKYGYLKLEWVQDKEGFIHKPFYQQILAYINIDDFTHCANAGWLGGDAPAMALQWHSYLRKPQSALPVQDEKKLPLLEQRISVIRKVLKNLGYDDPADFKPFSKTIKESRSIKTSRLYELCLLEDHELFRGISHPNESESFRTEIWSKAKEKFLFEKQKHNTVG